MTEEPPQIWVRGDVSGADASLICPLASTRRYRVTTEVSAFIDRRRAAVILLTRGRPGRRGESFNFISCWQDATGRHGTPRDVAVAATPAVCLTPAHLAGTGLSFTVMLS